MDVISERLTKLRDEKGATQEEVAEACGMSRVTLARYENGTRKPIPENLSRLAEYYGKTVDYLLGREENPLVESYEETFSRPLVLDGESLRGLIDDRPETEAIRRNILQKLDALAEIYDQAYTDVDGFVDFLLHKNGKA